jgi:hypothetical protein
LRLNGVADQRAGGRIDGASTSHEHEIAGPPPLGIGALRGAPRLVCITYLAICVCGPLARDCRISCSRWQMLAGDGSNRSEIISLSVLR